MKIHSVISVTRVSVNAGVPASLTVAIYTLCPSGTR